MDSFRNHMVKQVSMEIAFECVAFFRGQTPYGFV